MSDNKDEEKPSFPGFEKLEHLLRNKHDRELRRAQEDFQKVQQKEKEYIALHEKKKEEAKKREQAK